MELSQIKTYLNYTCKEMKDQRKIRNTASSLQEDKPLNPGTRGPCFKHSFSNPRNEVFTKILYLYLEPTEQFCCLSAGIRMAYIRLLRDR